MTCKNWSVGGWERWCGNDVVGCPHSSHHVVYQEKWIDADMSHVFDHNNNCRKCDAPRDKCHENESAAWKQKASRLYDLLHEVAPFCPVSKEDLYSRISEALDEGVLWLDEKLICCDGDGSELEQDAK